MIESNLVEGNQSIDAKPLKYGQSITDACVNLSDTEVILEQLSKAVLARVRRN
jgi:3-deoxy-7-phosphoheptulonate synthase